MSKILTKYKEIIEEYVLDELLYDDVLEKMFKDIEKLNNIS